MIIKVGELNSTHLGNRITYSRLTWGIGGHRKIDISHDISMITHTKKYTIVRDGNSDYKLEHDLGVVLDKLPDGR